MQRRLHGAQRQAGEQDVAVVTRYGDDTVGAQAGETDPVAPAVDRHRGQRVAVGGRESDGAVAGVRHHGGLGDGAVEQAGAEGGLGLPAGVGAVVGVGCPLVFQAGGEAASRRRELFVETCHQESLERDDGGDPDRQTGGGEQHQQPGGELAAQGAWQGTPHGASGFRT